MHPIFENFKKHLQKNYFPDQTSVLDDLSGNLISPFTVQLPRAALQQAQNIVDELYKLVQLPYYREQVQKETSFDLSQVQQTPSMLCSLDCHWLGGQLKIIEVNTNASTYLVNLENYRQRNIGTFPNAEKDLLDSFRDTFGERLKPGNLFLIIDENPQDQHLYVEFLMFQKFLQTNFGVEAAVADHRELQLAPDGSLTWKNKKVTGIYNRHTDFYFANDKNLFEANQHSHTLISPNPLGYALLADKKRLLLLQNDFFKTVQSQAGWSFPELQKALLKIKKFSDFASPDELWSQRAHYFFKPPNSFGGKSVYKGKSISRTVFQRIFADNYLAQEAAPAPGITLRHENQDYTFKYDLRFYFFKNRVHLAVARLYQGQLTNLKTPFGGLAPIDLV